MLEANKKAGQKKWYLGIIRGLICVRPYPIKRIVATVTEKEVADKVYGGDHMPLLEVNKYGVVWDYFQYYADLVYTNPSGVDCLTNKGLELYWRKHNK